MTLEEFIEGAKGHDDIMEMLKNLMDLTPVLVIIVEGRAGRESWDGAVLARKWDHKDWLRQKPHLLNPAQDAWKRPSSFFKNRFDTVPFKSAGWQKEPGAVTSWWTVIGCSAYSPPPSFPGIRLKKELITDWDLKIVIFKSTGHLKIKNSQTKVLYFEI